MNAQTLTIVSAVFVLWGLITMFVPSEIVGGAAYNYIIAAAKGTGKAKKAVAAAKKAAPKKRKAAVKKKSDKTVEVSSKTLKTPSLKDLLKKIKKTD